LTTVAGVCDDLPDAASYVLASYMEKTVATKQRLGLREVRALKPGEIVWDPTIPGFGARRQRSEAISYVLFYRTKEGRQRWFTIGRHGAPWTPETARSEAQRLLGSVASNSDPALEKRTVRNAHTVSELCDLYFADAESGRLMTRHRSLKKASTLITDRGRIERHIKPLLGRRIVASVTREDVESFMHDVAAGKTAAKAKTKPRGLARVRGGKGTATRTVGLLGAIFTYAVRHRMRPDNPVHGVTRPADGRRERRLSNDEYKALGDGLRKAEKENVWPAAVAAARFLALTGWRSGEVLALRREEIDVTRRTAILGDTKTGRSVRPIAKLACEMLRSHGSITGLAFPATRGDGLMVGFPKFWSRIAKLGKLSRDVTPHTLRHSFASLAADLGYAEPTIATLIGHKRHSITSRYVHTADAVLLAAADAVADRTSALMGERKSGVVVSLRQTSR
jgi:integrase